MAIQRLVRPALLLAGGALTLVLTTACQGQFTASGSMSDNPTTSNVAAGGGGTAGSTGGGGSGPATGTGSTPECKSGNLKLSLGSGDGGGAGSTYPAIQFTNSGSSTCVVGGFPGVSYVGGSDGHQIGAPATRSGGASAAVTLRPGAMASATVQAANAGNFDATDCQPVQARGFRVYAPGDTAAMYLAFGQPQTACSDVKVSQLSVHSVTAGSGSPQATTSSATRCGTSDLHAKLGAETGADGAAHTVSLVYTNISGHTCTMNGFGGVDLRGPADPNGAVDSLRRGPDPQLSPSDPRYVSPGRPSLVTLAPGASAHTVITFASNTPGSGTTGSNGSTTWTPDTVVWTAPDDTSSLTIAWLPGVNVLRQDSATISGTYIGPVVSGV